MNPEERNANKLRKVASLLKNDLNTTVELGTQVKEFAREVPNYNINDKNPYIYAVAVNLQHFYTSLETIFKRVAKELEGDLPSGESWYQELLEQMFIEIEDIRPPLFSNNIKKELDELRRFRHVVRHGYEYDLDWDKINPLVKTLEKIIPRIKEDIHEFNSFLLNTARQIEKDPG